MRLIDADALKKHYAWWEDDRQKLFDSIVDSQPTVDAVPVIRCKNCIWFSIDQLKADGTPDRRCKPTWCSLHRTYAEAEFFCSWGNAE